MGAGNLAAFRRNRRGRRRASRGPGMRASRKPEVGKEPAMLLALPLALIGFVLLETLELAAHHG